MIERIRVRVLLGACAACAVLALITVVVLALIGVVEPLEAVFLGSFAVIFSLVVLGAFMSLRTFTGLRFTINRVARIEALEDRSRGAVLSESAKIGAAIADLGNQYKAAEVGAHERNEAMSRDLIKHIARESLQTYWQMEALIDLRTWIAARAPLPSLRGWAASPDVLHWMLAWIHDHRPAVIVECGSGASTVIFGYQIQRVGIGRVISLEHDPRYASQTRELVRRHEIGDVVEVRYAPLQAWEGAEGSWEWYDRAAIQDIDEIDLLFVDGPPGGTGRLARYPAGPLLFGRLSATGVAVLDDAGREDERRIGELWLERMEWLDCERLKTEKGTDIFRRRIDA
jgi:predicted O-methyltransferase YrrM